MTPSGVTITAKAMQAALDAGHAHHLAPLVTDFIHYRGTWWIAYADTWLRVDDPELLRLLDTTRRRFAGGLYGPADQEA